MWIDYRGEKDVTKIPDEIIIELFADEAYLIEKYDSGENRHDDLRAEILRRMKAI